VTVLPDLVVRDLPPARVKAQVRPLVTPAPVREIGLATSRTDLRRSVTSVLESAIHAALATVLAPAPRRVSRLDPMSEPVP
jgi:hypothetical protein